MIEKKNTLITAVLIAVMVIICGATTWAVAKEHNRLDTLRAEGLAKLKKTADLSDYRSAEKKDVRRILGNYKTKVQAVSDREELDKLLTGAKAKIGKVKTDAQ